MALQLVGEWKLVETSSNFEAYLQHMNYGYIARKFALRASPQITITESKSRWKIVYATSVRTFTTEVSEGYMN